ncbi:MAG TPA: hypothetical protein VNA89_13055 [Gemmatimonadaceae bacterium]|nr:hypothetical protein [Gemmatimonadaceae bacterium]
MPANARFMVAAYLAVLLIYGGYALVLWRRARRLAARERAGRGA